MGGKSWLPTASGNTFPPDGPGKGLSAVMPAIFGLLVMSLGMAWAKTESPASKASASVQADTLREHISSIPLPNGAVHLGKGITGAFMGGKYRNRGDDKSLFQWQGEVGYFYTRYFSAGVGFKITAGEPDTTAQSIRNRYFLNARLHKNWPRACVFIGPQLGLDNLNVLTENPDTLSLKKPIENTNAGLGLEVGGGWKVFRWGGLTLGNNLEYSLVGESASGSSLNLRVTPGVAIDVLAFTKTLKELVPALYVNVEFQVGYLLLERSSKRHDQAMVLGLGLAF
jgi:hypothetical protein